MAADSLLCYIDFKPKRADFFDSPVIFEDALKGYSTHLHCKGPKRRATGNKIMKFDKEMDRFFMRNCYSEREREQVRVWPPYQLARDKNDPTEAQEIATQFLETKANNRPEARQTL
jgi:hypothetical protein